MRGFGPGVGPRQASYFFSIWGFPSERDARYPLCAPGCVAVAVRPNRPDLIASCAVRARDFLFYDQCNLAFGTDPRLRLCFWSLGLTGETLGSVRVDEMRIPVNSDRAWMVGLTKTASGGAQVCIHAAVPGRDQFYQHLYQYQSKPLIPCPRSSSIYLLHSTPPQRFPLSHSRCRLHPLQPPSPLSLSTLLRSSTLLHSTLSLLFTTTPSSHSALCTSLVLKPLRPPWIHL